LHPIIINCIHILIKKIKIYFLLHHIIVFVIVIAVVATSLSLNFYSPLYALKRRGRG